MPDQILTDALERFKASESGSSINREHSLEDTRFARLGEQWPAAILTQRQQEGRPALTINRMPSFIRQVVNDARQNKPSMSVHPVDNGDYDAAQVIGGLLRSIERASNADVAYDTALDNAVTGGFGFFRATIDYVHPTSFDKELRIERISNPHSVHWDTGTVETDASDWEYAFVSDWLTERDFKRQFPKGKPIDFQGGRGDAPGWFDEKKVRVSEYFLREERKQKLYLFPDGQALSAKQVMAQAEELLAEFGMPKPANADVALRMLSDITGIAPTKERETTLMTVKVRKLNGVEVLDENDWPGSLIPIAPVWGEEVVLEGRRYYRSLIRDARDPQMMFNFWRSATTELVALAPRAPWVVQAGSIPDESKHKWDTANSRAHAYLEFEGDVRPERQPFAGVPAGAMQEALSAADDLKSITGIYDAALGAKSNETSGRAIIARQRESDVGTFHFIDNLSRAIRYMGNVLVEAVPSVYSERQSIQILGTDDAPKVIRLAQTAGAPPSAEDPDGKIYNIAVGQYDVTVQVGPSFTTQRQEAAQAMMELVRAQPQAAIMLGDLIVKAMDWPEADVAAKRIKLVQTVELMKMLPPGTPLMTVEQAVEQLEKMSGQPAPQMGPPMPPQTGAAPPAAQ